MNKKQGSAKIKKQYKVFKKEINDLWDAFHAINSGMLLTKEMIKKSKKPILKIPMFYQNKTKKYKVNTQCGLIEHILVKRNLRTGLFESIAIFENYLADILTAIYNTYPHTLVSSDPKNSSNIRYLNIIIKSEDKDQMIEQIAEDKVRTLMYASPKDFFVKDKGNLNFGNLFKKHQDLIDKFVELSARRNIYIHNGGHVNKDYLNYISNSKFKEGNIAKMNQEYIVSAIYTIKELSKIITIHVLSHFYKTNLNQIRRSDHKK